MGEVPIHNRPMKEKHVDEWQQQVQELIESDTLCGPWWANLRSESLDLRTLIQQIFEIADLNTARILIFFKVHRTGFMRTSISKRLHTPDLRT